MSIPARNYDGMKQIGANFCFGMVKNILSILIVFGLFSPTTEGTVAKPISYVLTVILLIAATRGGLHLIKIIEREEVWILCDFRSSIDKEIYEKKSTRQKIYPTDGP